MNAPIDPNDPATFNNAPPIATDDEFTSLVGTTLSSSVISNDADPDGDIVVIADTNGDPATAAQAITTTAGGTVTLNTDGTFDYTPPADFLGEDSFDYTIVDPSGATDNATVTLNVIADSDPNDNDAPEAGDDFATAPAGETATANLLDNDTDPTGESLAIIDVNGTDPATGPISVLDENDDPAGTLVVDPTSGLATFMPEPGFVGTVQVPYTIIDENGGTDTASIVFTITDLAPEAEDDINVTTLDTPVSGNLLLNDSDPNPADSITVVDPATGEAATGPLTITTNGGGTVVVDPDGSYQYLSLIHISEPTRPY